MKNIHTDSGQGSDYFARIAIGFTGNDSVQLLNPFEYDSIFLIGFCPLMRKQRSFGEY